MAQSRGRQPRAWWQERCVGWGQSLEKLVQSNDLRQLGLIPNHHCALSCVTRTEPWDVGSMRARGLGDGGRNGE